MDTHVYVVLWDDGHPNANIYATRDSLRADYQGGYEGIPVIAENLIDAAEENPGEPITGTGDFTLRYLTVTP